MASKRSRNRSNLALGLLAASLAILAVVIFTTTGCGNFFVPPTTTSTGTTGSTTTDYAYFINSSSGAAYISAYNLSAGTFSSAVTGSPFAVSFTPLAMVVNPADTYLYVTGLVTSGSASGTYQLFGFSISSTGVLTSLNGGAALYSPEQATALAISPDGDYLFALNAGVDTIDQLAINTSTGLLSFDVNYTLNGPTDGGAIVPTALAFAPSGDFLVAALGSGGAEVIPYANNLLTTSAYTQVNPANTSIGINGAAVDSSNRIYLAETNTSSTPGLLVYSSSSSGVLSSSPIATASTGNGAHNIVVTSAGTYVYVANDLDSTISAFSLTTSGTTTTLTALTTTPYAAPASIAALARDNTGAYLLAGGYSASSGYEIYSIGSTGLLTAAATAASGTSTSTPAAIAATH